MLVEMFRGTPSSRGKLIAPVARSFCLINVLFLFLKFPTFHALLLNWLKLLNC